MANSYNRFLDSLVEQVESQISGDPDRDPYTVARETVKEEISSLTTQMLVEHAMQSSSSLDEWKPYATQDTFDAYIEAMAYSIIFQDVLHRVDFDDLPS